MAPKAYTFRATLIGTTKQQDVNFCLQSAGISITGIGQNSSRVIANLAFPYIEKISRSACGKGTSRILDISVQTKAGLQNLKVLVETANTADQLLSQFHKLASAYLEQERSASVRSSRKPATPTFSRAASFSHPQQLQGLGHASAVSRGNTVKFASAPLPSAEPAPPAVIDRLPSASSVLQSKESKEQDDAQLSLARQQIRYLENYVSRVTTRLTQIHQEQGKKGYIDADPDEAIASASRASGTGELKWDQVQPLLTEYDEMIYTLQTKLTERQEELGRFEVKLDDISKENAALVGKLKHVLQEEVTMVVSEVNAPAEEHVKRVELLLQENNVLTKQNAELDKEVARVNTDNEALAKQLLDATQQYGETCVTLKNKEEEVKNMASSLNELQSQAMELEEKLAEDDTCRLDAQQAAADLESLRQQHADLVAQHEATVRCAEEASATAVALRAELDTFQADLAAAAREVETSNSAAEELRKTVVALRQDLAEHREKDAEVIARIQDAKEASEQYKLAQKASETRENQLQEEVASLRKLYSEAQAQVATAAASASTDAEVLTLKSELARMKQAFSSLEDTTSQLRSSNKKLEKEKWALHARIDESVKGAPSADSLAVLRRALDAERECESVKMQFESMKRSVKQHQLEDDVHVKKLEAQLEEANRTISTWATSTVGTKHEASVLERQLESTRKQLQALKEESQRTEAQLRAEVASARGEHSSEVQMLVTKLEESVATYNSSVAEAERMMGAKEELLRKYKDEARAASSKLQSYQGVMKDKEAEIASMRGRLGAMQRDRDKFKSELEDAESAAGFGRTAREQAIKASREVADLQNRNEAESRKRRQLEIELDRAKLIAERAARKNAELTPIQTM